MHCVSKRVMLQNHNHHCHCITVSPPIEMVYVYYVSLKQLHGSWIREKKNTVEANRRIVTCKINKSRYEKRLLLSFISMYAQSNKEPWVPFWYYTTLVYRHFKWWTTIPKINHNQHDSHNSTASDTYPGWLYRLVTQNIHMGNSLQAIFASFNCSWMQHHGDYTMIVCKA